MDKEDRELGVTIRAALKTAPSRRQQRLREADSKQMFSLGVLLMAILSAVFGLYDSEPDRAFYRYAFLGYAAILMIAGGIQFDRANKLKRKAYDDLDEDPDQSSAAPDPNDPSGGDTLRRVK